MYYKVKKTIWKNRKINNFLKNSQKVVTNRGYLLTKLNSEKLIPIKNEIKEIKYHFENNKVSHQKYNIREFFLSEEANQYLEKLLLPYILHHEESFNYMRNLALDSNQLKLKKAWVNFQKKYEYNPLHTHKGILSFVIWIQIPYRITDEISYFNEEDYEYKKVNGMFTFYHTDSLGKIIPDNIPVDSTFNNKLLMFPSIMSHSVQPFYSSDEYRISISGNFVVDT
jgi:hypothetical protein